MDIILAARTQRVKPSPTLAVAAEAARLKAAGHLIHDLSAGEPDFDTPDFIKTAAIHAIERGFTKYTPVGGTPSLKAAIIEKFARDNQLQFTPSQILVSVGAKHSLYNAFQALLNAGDAVLIPAPYWVSYPDMALLADATPIFIPTTPATGFRITPDLLRAAITPRTKMLILNAPGNPSGMLYTRAELEALGAVLREHPQIWIITDDIYEHLCWKQYRFCNLPMACPDLLDRTLIVHGVSKSYAMTGWRIGFTAGPARVIAAMTTIQSQSTSNPTSIAQVAAEAALRGPQDCVHLMCQAYEARHDLCVSGLAAIPGIQCLPGHGAFYAFPDCTGLIEAHGLKDDYALAEALLGYGVACVPGSAFGTPNHLRCSFATDENTLYAAIAQIRTYAHSK